MADYVHQNYKLFKGQILMGSGLDRKYRHNDNSTGYTVWDYKVPTLTLAGSRDGLYRITRNAEAYWHQVVHVARNQVGQFPVVWMGGLSHASYMDESMLTSFVKSNDLKADVSQDAAYRQISA